MPKGQVLEFIENKLSEKSEEYDESFIVFDLDDIAEKYDAWVQLMPRVVPFYAVKCNSDDGIIKKMISLGMNFDCASLPEMQKVISMGATPDQIIYANPCKQVSHLRRANDLGIKMVTFDNADELKKVKEYAPDMGVILRLATDDSKAICALSNKFGAYLKDVEPLLKRVNKLELDFLGFSFHVGSGSEDENAFPNAIANARKAFDIAESLGFHPKILDIGGGFPGAKVEFNAKKGFPVIAKKVSKALDQYFPKEGGYNIIGEPGRYMVGSSGTLVAAVVARRKPIGQKNDTTEEVANAKDESIMYYISEGVYGALNNTIYDHAHVTPKVLDIDVPGKHRVNIHKEYNSSVWGPTCDGLDCVVKGIPLPKLEVGSWIYFEDMGAYTVAASTTFNGFSKAHIYYLGADEEEQPYM